MSIELHENGVPAQTPRVGNGGAQVIAAREALAVCFGSRADEAGKDILTFVQHWSGAVTCPAF